MNTKKRRSLESGQGTLTSDGQCSTSRKESREFKNQDVILTSLVRNLVGSGGLAIQVAERDWFRQFMTDVELRFKPVSRVAIKRELNDLYQEGRDEMLKEISAISFKPTVTVDFWTG